LNRFFAALVLLTVCLYGSAAHAQSASNISAPDEARLIQKIKEEILKELREGNFLAEQIELGIQNYIKKQEAAQADARAEEDRQAAEKAKSIRRVSMPRDHVYGNPNAPVSLIEYSDFECPFCKRFHSTAMEIVDAYGGKVNWVYRHFPLSMHNPGAQKEAEASECVAQLGGNDAFWKYADAIYARTQSNGNGFPLTQLVPLAKEIGIDENRFKECTDSGRYDGRVQEDLNEGSQIGVTGTPANFLLRNDTGEVIVKVGAQPLDAFKADIEKMLTE
jgi:protein-disulfide isomerase